MHWKLTNMENFDMLSSWRSHCESIEQLKTMRVTTVSFIISELKEGNCFEDYPNLVYGKETLQFLNLYETIWSLVIHAEKDSQNSFWSCTKLTEKLEDLRKRYYCYFSMTPRQIAVEFLELTSQLVVKCLKFFNVLNVQQLRSVMKFSNPWTLINEGVHCPGEGNLLKEFRVHVEESTNYTAPAEADSSFESDEEKEPAKQKQFLSLPHPSFVFIQVQEEDSDKLKVLMVVCKTILIDDVNLKQVIPDSDGWKHDPPDLLTLFVVVLSHCILQVFRSLIILIDDHDDSYDPVWKLNDRDLCDLSLSDMDTWKWIIEPLGEDLEICADGSDDIDWDPDG